MYYTCSVEVAMAVPAHKTGIPPLSKGINFVQARKASFRKAVIKGKLIARLVNSTLNNRLRANRDAGLVD